MADAQTPAAVGPEIAPQSEPIPGRRTPWEPLAALAVWGLVGFVRVLPLGLFGPFTATLATLYRWLSSRDRRVLRRNAIRVLGLEAGSDALRRFEREVMHHQVLTAFEWIRGAYQPGLVESDEQGLEQLRRLIDDARSTGRGAILITAHLGSWEEVAHCHRQASGRTLYALAQAATARPVSALLRDLRRRKGCEVLWSGERAPLRQVLKLLRAGESMAFVMDQKPRRRRGPRVEFFGHAAEFVGGPASIALRTGARVIALFPIRQGPFRHRIVVEAVPTDGLDELELTQRFADVIEAAIRQAPEQWSWNYRRWYFEDPEQLGAGKEATS